MEAAEDRGAIRRGDCWRWSEAALVRRNESLGGEAWGFSAQLHFLFSLPDVDEVYPANLFPPPCFPICCHHEGLCLLEL